MRKRRMLGTIATFAIAGLAVGAVPAFTADNGTITVTITAEAPASPCIEFATPPGTQVGFGTRPFSTTAQVSSGLGDVAPRFWNCSTATQTFLIAGTDAVSSDSTWTLGGGVGNPCPTQGIYRLFYNTDNIGSWPIAKTNALLKNLSTGATTFTPGELHSLGLELAMPCQGTAGAGRTFSLSVNLTAQIA
jgi:hypothetical protein